MFNTSLVEAVQRFAEVTHATPGPDLDREWTWGAYDSEGVRFAFFRTYEELRELVATTAAERAACGPAPTTAQRILAQYHAAYRDLQAALLGIGQGEEDQVPAEGDWPLRRVVGHIVGADVGFYVVAKYALDRYRAGDGRPAEVPDEAWDTIVGQDVDSVWTILDGPLAGTRSFHAAFHERILREFATVIEDELSAPSMYWEGYEMSLRFRLHRFDSHMRQHTVQVDKTLKGIGHAPNEAKRLLRLIYAALAEVEGVVIGAWDVGGELGRETADAIAARTKEIASILADT